MPTFPARVAVTGFAASELDINEEVSAPGDAVYRLVAQWTGSHVVVYDVDHATALAEIARDWSNDLDRDLYDGAYDRCAETKRHYRAIMLGLSGLSQRLFRLTH